MIPTVFGVQSPVLVALGTGLGYIALLAWAVRRRGWQGWHNRALHFFLTLSIIWSAGFGVALWFGLNDAEHLLGLRLAYATLTLMSPLLAGLTLLFLERPGVRWLLTAAAAWLVAVMAVEANLFNLQTILAGARTVPANELIQPLQIAGWAGFGLSTFALAILDFLQTRRPLHRNRILFWLIGASLLIGGETLTLLDQSRWLIDTIQIGLTVRLLGAIVITVATITYNLPVLRNVARRAFAALITTVVLAALILAGMWVVLTTTGQTVSPLTFVVAVAAAALLAIFQQPLRLLMHRLSERLINRGHYNPARALRDYGDAIRNILDLDTLITVAVGIIAEALDVRRGALLLTTERPAQQSHEVEVQILPGMGVLPIDRGTLAVDSPILGELQQGNRPLTQYEIDILPQYRSAVASERAWLQSLDMEVYVPIRSQGALVGVFAFGRRESGEPHTAQDLDVLMTVGNQTAVVLQNARLVSDLKAANRSITRLNDELSGTNRRLEKLDTAKTDFIEIASHELRTPLTQIRGYSDILSDMMQHEQIVPAHMSQVSSGITRASVRLEAIIAAMLDVSRIDAEALDIRTAPLAVPGMIRLALDNYKEAIRDRQMNIQTIGLETLPPVQGDLQRLCQAFSNLIGNSIKFTPDGGLITITGKMVEQPVEDGKQLFVELLIADTGIGIDQNDQQLIFEKFYRVGTVELHSTGTTKFKGAGPGLGLPIAKGVIQAHGGKIWVESPGYDEERLPGSTFHILLPAALTLSPNGNGHESFAAGA